jgi:hypothetical protein
MLGGGGRPYRDRRDRRLEHDPAVVTVSAHAARGVTGRTVIPSVGLEGLGGRHARFDADDGGVIFAKTGRHADRGRDDKQRQDAGGKKAAQVPPPCLRSTHDRSIASGAELENALHDHSRSVISGVPLCAKSYNSLKSHNSHPDPSRDRLKKV